MRTMDFSFRHLAALASCLSLCSAMPMVARGGGLQIVATTTTSSGQVIDWVLPESQGVQLASPPPAPEATFPLTNVTQPNIQALVAAEPALQGPAGTVPIARSNPGGNTYKGFPGQTPQRRSAQDSYAGDHWYSSTAQVVTNLGGTGVLSMFDAYVESSSDFSLLQTAVIRTNVPLSAGGTTMQTVEAGWINFPNQVASPHIFSFFTTNGYTADGDNIGGWNRDQSGWVQTDSQVYPGFEFAQISTDGGTNYDLNIEYQLRDGNWWLWVVDRWIGYYPASLFTNGVSASDTLESGSSQINWYGEVFNSEEALTTTDMGSGEFASAGSGRAGYIHNIAYYDSGLNAQTYDGSAQVIVSDTSRYTIDTHFNSGTTWGSYFYLGGPGAGGQIGS